MIRHDIAPSALLESVPDPFATAEVGRRVDELLSAASAFADAAEAPFAALDLAAVAEPSGPLGRDGNPAWRRAVFATLLADWASYEAPVDRAEFPRLAFVANRFPAGFRVWFAGRAGEWLPVGYTGWYPIEEYAFDRLFRGTPALRDRMFVPLTSAPASGGFLYLFNYSAARPFRKSRLTRELLTSYASDVEAQRARGLSAITVSPDGVRVASRFGLAKTGEFEIDGAVEYLYAVRRT